MDSLNFHWQQENILSPQSISADCPLNPLPTQQSSAMGTDQIAIDPIQVTSGAVVSPILPMSPANGQWGTIASDVFTNVNNSIQQFFSNSDYLTGLQTAFGTSINIEAATEIADRYRMGGSIELPEFKILSSEVLGNIQGGFDTANNQIYLAQNLIDTQNIESIAEVAIEEIGHYLDTKLNTQDAAGDEGQIFANLVKGMALTPSQLAEMRSQDDRQTITLNGQSIAIEAAEGDNGVYTVDRNGKLFIDYLTDAGSYTAQVAAFSLKGMESLQPGSVEFIQEAARRALTSSTEGYIVINDATDAGNFNLEADTNQGQYQGRKGFNFEAGDKIALMMVPNGTIAELFNNPNLSADKRPLFSIDAANPGSFKQLARVAESMMSWEDLRRDVRSDADFNDVVFQMKGTLGTGAADLKNSLGKDIKWQDSQVCRQMEDYVAQHLGAETIAPKLTVALVNDTGSSNNDWITKDPTIRIRLQEENDLLGITAKFAGQERAMDISNAFRLDGSLTLDRALLEQVYGQTLVDGSYEIQLAATDDSGNTGTTTFKFILDTTAPTTAPTITLDLASDSGTVGDNRTNLTRVVLNGKAEANATLSITQDPVSNNGSAIARTIMADANGNFQLTGVDLAFGINHFTVTATDLAGNTSTTSTHQDIRRIAADDAVVTWNQELLKAISTAKMAPPLATRAMAMVQTAVFDAVNNISKKYQNYAFTETAPTGASAAAAAVEAAYTVLTHLFASQTATFDAARTKSLAAITDGQSETDGIAFGKLIADKTIASRANDGATAVVNYVPGTNPGDWQATATTTNPDGSKTPTAPVLPQWGNVKTFGIPQENVAATRPTAPPALTSEQYAAEFNQVKDLGDINSTTRTADQTEIAKFWVDGAGTFTPPGHWNEIAQIVAQDRGNSLEENARLFAMLDVAVADAAICCWDTKYAYNFWRPITAIRNADQDGNDGTAVDTSWTPLLTTPNFPAYTSGHSTFSSAGAAVLTNLYGDNYRFTTTSPGLPGVLRSFTSFSQARDEAGMSRIYGGIHFMSDNLQGIEAGTGIGSYVSTKLMGLA
jgi:hypothetical protein